MIDWNKPIEAVDTGGYTYLARVIARVENPRFPVAVAIFCRDVGEYVHQFANNGEPTMPHYVTWRVRNVA